MRHAIILAGGSGERFWPLSRDDRPKPFLSFFGDTSLLRATFLRIRPIIPASRIWVVTAEAHAARVRSELPEVPGTHVLGEPQGRNTAPAIAWAALRIQAEDPGAILLVLPADAWVPQANPFRQAVRSVLDLAEADDRLFLVGVEPSRPETGYGYIEPGTPLDYGPARAVRRFIEKPSPALARRFLASGRYLWNAGVFAWKSGVFLEEMDKHIPEVTTAFRGPLRTVAHVRAAYRKLPSISVDVGVLERSRRVGVLPARFAWDDLGTWAGLARLAPDFKKGHVIAWESPDTIVWAESGTVAVIGVPRAVVVRSGENVLVASLDRAQEVRRAAQILRKDSSRKRSRRVEP